MDGFEAERTGIVVMGATNRKDVLDPALTRPGRFDRSIEVARPDFKGRLECIKVHLRDKPLAADIDYNELAVLTGGMSGAQIAGVANAACFLASREGRSDVSQADLRRAVEQGRFGKTYEAHSFVSPARRRRFAVMEASIALAATLLPAIEPVERVTIQPSMKSPIGRTVLTVRLYHCRAPLSLSPIAAVRSLRRADRVRPLCPLISRDRASPLHNTTPPAPPTPPYTTPEPTQPNIARHTTGVWTKAYLEQQLLVALAGRAGEELVFGPEELSSLNPGRLQLASQLRSLARLLLLPLLLLPLQLLHPPGLLDQPLL